MVITINASQIEAAIRKRLSSEKLKAAAVIGAKEMDKIKNEKTRKHESPAVGGEWDNRYSAKYAKAQGKKINAVNLRANKPTRKKSIEKTNIKVIGNVAVLSFNDKAKARIFNYHDKGLAKGRRGRENQIYPRNLKQLPIRVIEAIRNFLAK